MPAPSVVVLMHRETEWPGHLQLQPVHAILGPLHPGEEAMPSIPNLQHSAFNQHARASFVHLPNTKDLVLTVAPGKDDGALSTDVDDGAS
jgi:hypothetical protein